MSALVRAGTAVAVAGAVHAAVNARLVRRPEPVSKRRARASVLVPARDEAAHIAACIESLRVQDVVEILVLDDGSSDATARLARAAAAGDPRVRVLAGSPIPPGWLGKAFACAQLAAAAEPGSEVLVFVDADVRLAPDAVASAVALLDSLALDLVSPQPRQVAVTAAERLVQPLLAWSWLTFLPLRLAERSRRPPLGAANGQFLAVRRAAYERAGGHDRVRADVLDDLALLRAVKRAGGHGTIVDGSRLASCRMYEGWSSLRDGYAKSLWAAFGSEPGAAAVVGLLGLGYLVPAVAAGCGSRVGAFGYAAGVVGRLVTARTGGDRAWPDTLSHPASVAMFAYLTANSLVQRRRATLRWKGRPVPLPRQPVAGSRLAR